MHQQQEAVKSLNTHQLPTLSFKQPFKQSRQVKSYVSYKDITKAIEKPKTGLLDLAKCVLRRKDQPIEILTSRLASLYKRRANKENSMDAQPAQPRRIISIREKCKMRHQKRNSDLACYGKLDQNIVLKICRLELHQNSQNVSQPTQLIKTRQCPRTCNRGTRAKQQQEPEVHTSKRRKRTQYQGRLSAWQITSMDQEF